MKLTTYYEIDGEKIAFETKIFMKNGKVEDAGKIAHQLEVIKKWKEGLSDEI